MSAASHFPAAITFILVVACFALLLPGVAARALAATWEVARYDSAPREKFGVSAGVADDIFLFGGISVNRQFLGSTARLILSSATSPLVVEEVFPPTSPPPTFGIQLATINETIYSFGGHRNDIRLTDEVWMFHLSSRAWILLVTQGTTPGPLSKYGRTSDASSGVITYFFGLAPNSVINDVWELNVVDRTWQLLWTNDDGKAVAAQTPKPRFDPCCVRRGDSSVCFGGTVDTGDTNEVWLFNHTLRQWRLLPTTEAAPGSRPSPRRLGMCELTPDDAAMLVFCGWESGQSNYVLDTAVHRLDFALLEWSAVRNQPEVLIGRDSGQLIRTGGTDVAARRLWLLGGNSQKGRLNDIWELSAATLIFEPRSSGSNLPLPREHHNAAVVGESMFVMYGRQLPQLLILHDLWSFHFPTNTWTEHRFSGTFAPRGRYGASVVVRGFMLLFYGGIDEGAACLDEMLSLNTNSSVWTPVEQSGELPGPRAFHGAAVMAGRMLLLGGVSRLQRPMTDALHIFSFEHSTWSHVIGHETMVGPRRNFAFLPNFAETELLIMGGHASAVLGDRIRLTVPIQHNDTTWTIVPDQLSSVMPQASSGFTERDVIRAEAAAVRSGELVIYCGGAISPSFPMRLASACVQYNVTSGTHDFLQPMPHPVVGATAVHYRNKIFVFGGQLLFEAIRAPVTLNYLQVLTIESRELCANGSGAATSCFHCSAGTANPTCTPSPPGRYAPLPYADSIPCSAGSFSPFTAASMSSICRLCPSGTFAPLPGMTECLPCTRRCRLGSTADVDEVNETAGTTFDEYNPMPLREKWLTINWIYSLGGVAASGAFIIFVIFMLSKIGLQQVRAYYLPPELVEVPHGTVFRAWDRFKSCSGEVGIGEQLLLSALLELGVERLTPQAAVKYFRRHDIDGSGILAFDEFQLVVCEVIRDGLLMPYPNSAAYMFNEKRMRGIENGDDPSTLPPFVPSKGLFVWIAKNLNIADLDLYADQHDLYLVGEARTIRPTVRGGLCTLVFVYFFLVVALLLVASFVTANLFETRATVPPVSVLKKVTADFNLGISFMGVRDEPFCVTPTGACAAGFSMRNTSLGRGPFTDVGSVRQSCTFFQQQRTCLYNWTCTTCSLLPDQVTELRLQTPALLYAYRLKAMLRISSGVVEGGDAVQSIAWADFVPSSGAGVLRGYPESLLDVRLVPTVFSAPRGSFQHEQLESTGYHTEVLGAAMGNVADMNSFNQVFGVPLTLVLRPATAVLIIQRKPLQTVLQLISSVLGVLPGLGGLVLFLLRVSDRITTLRVRDQISQNAVADDSQEELIVGPKCSQQGEMSSSLNTALLSLQLQRDLHAAEVLLRNGIAVPQALSILQVAGKAQTSMRRRVCTMDGVCTRVPLGVLSPAHHQLIDSVESIPLELGCHKVS